MGPGFHRLKKNAEAERIRKNTADIQGVARRVAELEIAERELMAVNSNGRNDTALWTLRKRLDAARIELKKLNRRK